MKSVLALAGVAALAVAAPADPHAEIKSVIAKRALTDPDILNFALTLEHLEATFYAQALQKYDASAFTSAGYGSNIRNAIQEVANDEAAHVAFLTAGLQAAGATPVQACTYSFPYTSVNSFLAVAQILEGVGVSAYLGAAGSITNKAYLTAAATILTVEARHNAFIRYINTLSPFPGPFDTPILPQGIVTLATPFFSSCPNGSAPALAGFPAINVSGTATPGSTLTIASSNTTGATFCTFLSGLNSTSSAYSSGSCQIPSNGMVGDGQVYVFLTNAQNVSATTVVAGPGILEVDTGSQAAGQPANSSSVGGGSSGSGSGSSGSSGSGSSGSSSGAGHLAASGLAATLLAGLVSLVL